jgi:hypothetical protein
MRNKSVVILKAVAAGQTCEQILAADHSLSYHDVFHAIAEAPTSHWKKAPASSKGASTGTGLFRRAIRQRID